MYSFSIHYSSLFWLSIDHLLTLRTSSFLECGHHRANIHINVRMDEDMKGKARNTRSLQKRLCEAEVPHLSCTRRIYPEASTKFAERYKSIMTKQKRRQANGAATHHAMCVRAATTGNFPQFSWKQESRCKGIAAVSPPEVATRSREMLADEQGNGDPRGGTATTRDCRSVPVR